MTENTDHKYLDLDPDIEEELDRGVHKPKISVYVEYPDDEERKDDPSATEMVQVVMMMDAQWGKGHRWAEMTPVQARQLAKLLNDHATVAEAEIEDMELANA